MKNNIKNKHIFNMTVNEKLQALKNAKTSIE